MLKILRKIACQILTKVNIYLRAHLSTLREMKAYVYQKIIHEYS